MGLDRKIHQAKQFYLVITIATLIGMPIGNPLSGQPNGFSIGLAIDGLVFLAALILVRQTGLL